VDLGRGFFRPLVLFGVWPFCMAGLLGGRYELTKSLLRLADGLDLPYSGFDMPWVGDVVEDVHLD